jgi:Fic family protein
MNREKKTRALLAELGVPPESAAVSLKAAKDALLRVMPASKARAMTQAQLFEAATVVTRTTGQRALNELLSEGKIQRIGKGGPRDLFRYFQKRGEK